MSVKCNFSKKMCGFALKAKVILPFFSSKIVEMGQIRESGKTNLVD